MAVIDYKIANEAMAFFDIGEREYRNHMKLKDDKDIYAMIPAIVNLAFSIELFLKSVLDESAWGHDLKKLFCAIPEKEQKVISQLTIVHMQTWGFECSEELFWEYLEVNKLVFEEWRYFYQRGKTVNIAFLLALGCSLRNLLNITRECAVKN